MASAARLGPPPRSRRCVAFLWLDAGMVLSSSVNETGNEEQQRARLAKMEADRKAMQAAISPCLPVSPHISSCLPMAMQAAIDQAHEHKHMGAEQARPLSPRPRPALASTSSS